MNIDKYKELSDYYRRYPDLFMEQFYGIKLPFYQRVLVRIYGFIKGKQIGVKYGHIYYGRAYSKQNIQLENFYKRLKEILYE